MKVIDLHQDVLFHARGGGGVKAGSQTSFDALNGIGDNLVVAATFIPPRDLPERFMPEESDDEPKYSCISGPIDSDFMEYSRAMRNKSQWSFISIEGQQDLAAWKASNASSLLLHLEGLNEWPRDGWLSLNTWYLMGLRSLGIVWNKANPLGGGAAEPYYGLTKLGESVLRWCGAMGIVVDLAHANKRTFQRAVKFIDEPFMVSHANAAAVCAHWRNLADWQLRAVAAHEGVVGVSFVGGFVRSGGDAVVGDVADHIEYIRNLVGLSCVAVGSDFGGILDDGVAGLRCVVDLPNLWAELRRRGWDEADIECVAWRNAARVIEAVLI